jgi:hypothetical protein
MPLYAAARHLQCAVDTATNSAHAEQLLARLIARGNARPVPIAVEQPLL